LDHTLRRNETCISNSLYTGSHPKREKSRTHGDETWTKKYKTTGRTGDRRKLLHKTVEDRDVWSVAYVPPKAKRLKSTK